MFEKLKRYAKNPISWRVLTLALFVGLNATGYCADSGNADLDGQLTKVQDIIFGKQIRTIVLLFGMAWGFFKTFMSGTFTPILLYGGLGLSFFLVPKLIQLINSAA